MTEEKLNWYLREFTNPASRMALNAEERKNIYQTIIETCKEYGTEIPYWLIEE